LVEQTISGFKIPALKKKRKEIISPKLFQSKKKILKNSFEKKRQNPCSKPLYEKNYFTLLF